MQKQLVILALSFLMLSQGFMSLWSYVGFYANQDYIASNLCVKKDIPDNDCKGHCMLNKQIKKSQDQEQKDVNFQYREIHLFVQSIEFKFKFSQKQEISISTIFPELNSFFQKGFVDAVFRPPIA
jgi:hypothetical protein